MRCRRFEELIHRRVTGGLDAKAAAALERHLAACGGCRARLESARRVEAALAAEPALRAPRGFTATVMNAVYREAWKRGAAPAGEPREPAAAGRAATAIRAAAGVHPAAGAPAMAGATRLYRKLGLSFLLTSAILLASLLLPHASYPRLIRTEAVAADLSTGGAPGIKGMLDGAGGAVRGALRGAGGTQRAGYGGGMK